MSLKTRIEAYTGALAISATDFIKESIAKVAALIPPDVLMTAYTEIGQGVSHTGMKVIAASVGGYPAKEVTITDAAKHSDVKSIHYASARDPIYYRMTNGEYKTIPDDGAFYVVNFSGVTEADASITCLPPQYVEAVILDVAIARLGEKLSSIADAIAPTVDAVTSDQSIVTDLAQYDATAILSPLPTAAVLTSIMPATPAQITTLASLDLGLATALTTMPDYTANAQLGAAPSTFTLSLQRESADTGSGAVVLTYPAPLVANLTAVWGAIAFDNAYQHDTEVGDNLAALSTSLTTLNAAITADLNSTNEDIELGMARIQHTKEIVEQTLQKSELAFKRFTNDLDLAKLNAVKTYEATIEKSHTELALFAQEIQRFQTHAQLLMSEHKENVELWQLKSSFDIAVYKADYEKHLAILQLFITQHKENLELWTAIETDNLNRFKIMSDNVQATAVIVLNQFKSNLERWQSASATELAAYKANFERQQGVAQLLIANHRSRLDAWQANTSAKVSKYQLDIQNASEKYKTVTTAIQILQARFNSIFAPFQQEKK